MEISPPDCRSLRARALLVGLLFGALVPCASGQGTQSESLLLDSARSVVDFEIKVLWLVGVHGRFPRVHGAITLDHLHNTATVDARLDTMTVTMRSRSHEEWVKSAEFFDARHYPEIRFVSEPIPLQRLQSGGDIAGTLTLRGISKPVQFELAAATCPGASNEDCPVEAEGSIRRSDFGMKSRRGTLSDSVELNFTIYAASPAGSGVR